MGKLSSLVKLMALGIPFFLGCSDNPKSNKSYYSKSYQSKSQPYKRTTADRSHNQEKSSLFTISITEFGDNIRSYKGKNVRIKALPVIAKLEDNAKPGDIFSILIGDDANDPYDFLLCGFRREDERFDYRLCKAAYDAVNKEINDGDDETITVEGGYNTKHFNQMYLKEVVVEGKSYRFH